MSELIPPSANGAQPAHTRYNQLLNSLRRQIQQSMDNIRRYADRQRVTAYWHIGRSIADYTKRHGTAPGLYDRLAADTGIHLRTLQQCVQFAQAYPRLDPEVPLSWSHYRSLMSVESPAERARWEKRALKERWHGNDLRRFILEARSPALPPVPSGKAALPVQRGVLYTYRIIKVSYAQEAPGGFMVDGGFEVRVVPPPASGKIDNTRIVVSHKTPDGYALKLSKAAVSDIYTYKAVVERVIDGDTLLANVDCGFGIWIRQRLRLRGIDAPERRTAAGDRAHRWVAERLAACPFIVIKTYKTDKYDRYLADVFYQPPAGEGSKGAVPKGGTVAISAADPQVVAAKGALLNADLLKHRLASPWQP